MQDEWFIKLLNTFNNLKNIVPNGQNLILSIDTKDLKQILSALIELFKLAEDAIVKEKSKKFVTDTFENNVRHNATQLITLLVSEHDELVKYEDYRKLLSQRHIAYGFYKALDNGNIYKPNNLSFVKLEKVLYLGLVDFYKNFYGSFSDNEEAIKLLCKSYPKKILFFEDNINEIVNVTFRHVINAGTPIDVGFAYNGIDLISRFINNFPTNIIDRILQKYELYLIVNKKVYRHQIFTIIDNSQMSNEEKRKYKFSYLDSLILANNMNNDLYIKYSNNNTNQYTRYYNDFELDLSVEKISLIKKFKTNKIYAYWTNECSIERQFIVDEISIIHISLSADYKQITIHYTDKKAIQTIVKFNYEDWLLDDYHSKETEQKLHDFILEINSDKSKIAYKNLTFSLLYLNGYRGMNNQLVDFDHKFEFDKSKKILCESTLSKKIPHFYGEKVYSLSCIVGKNGTGKTSTVDFLRDTYFKLIWLIVNKKVKCENGYVKESDYKDYGILGDECEFFIVFNFGIKPYYLTNIENVNVTIANPFEFSTYKSVNELSKVVYFSNMLSVNHDNLYTDENMTFGEKSKRARVSSSLSEFRQADYSEAASFIEKRKAMEISKERDNKTQLINKDLCYQVAFLSYLTEEKLDKNFDLQSDKVFTLKSASLDQELSLTIYSIKELLVAKSSLLKKFLTLPDAKLEYFSSGQYAKFSFLAKLYWFLGGYQKFILEFENMIGKNKFSSNEALLDGETALIFIDEGELYYHPEWQRNYIKILLENIHNINSESTKVQVVITTNSPFIISDVLSEDVTYISNEDRDLDRTFGQNIHKLLKDNFFMSYTIGEYSREMIENIMRWLNNQGNKVNVGKELSEYFGSAIEPKDYYEKISCIIDKIGEPIYREKLLDMLRNSSMGVTKSAREELLRQKADIDRKLEELNEWL